MGQIVQCVPNFSEGRRPEVIDRIVAAATSVPALRLLEREVDPDHNRTVLAFAGEPTVVAEGAFRAVAVAVGLIDMDRHQGAHPRIGAADVVPFVPVAGLSMEDCVTLARDFGRRLASELGLPVYLYGDAALLPERRALPNVRKGEYEGLRAAVQTDPSRTPDYGPARLGPAGAAAVGARRPLVAYNLNLRGVDLAVAKEIARGVRESAGGLPGVRAIGLAVAGTDLVQVSMNLTDFRRTGLVTAYERVRELALAAGGEVESSRIIGLLPAEALVEVVARCLHSPSFAAEQIVERALLVDPAEGG